MNAFYYLPTTNNILLKLNFEFHLIDKQIFFLVKGIFFKFSSYTFYNI